jgi:hypothetical protein
VPRRGQGLLAGLLRLSGRALEAPATTNPIESTFATVKLRTRVTKGAGSRRAGLAMTFKLLKVAEKTWRRIDGQELVPLVRAGVRFVDGKRVERGGLQGGEHRCRDEAQAPGGRRLIARRSTTLDNISAKEGSEPLQGIGLPIGVVEDFAVLAQATAAAKGAAGEGCGGAPWIHRPGGASPCETAGRKEGAEARAASTCTPDPSESLLMAN